MEKVENKINLKFIFISLVIAFISPSIAYILKGRKIIDLVSSFTFFYTNITTKITTTKIMSTILFIGIFILISYIYYKILKNHKTEFKNKKTVATFITIISALFFIMLPLTSTDVFYYIGTGWSQAHYGVNPYYTSVDELMNQNEEAVNDEILLKMKGVWSNQTIVYGPIWPLICRILSGLSMGNLCVALFIYKLFNLGLHLVNTYLIYKITNKRNLFALMYGLNPLILFEGIANVHNEVLVIFFILLGLYFFIRKKNLVLTVISFALATAVKYFAILLIPFIILYNYRKEKPQKKILYSILWAILFIAVLAACYLLYMRDFDVLKGIITQQGKFSNSIFVIIAIKNITTAVIVSKGFMLAFIIIYITTIIKLIFTKKQYTFSKLIREYNELLILFIFGTLTTFQPWYTLWLLPTLIWDNSKNIKWLLSITILAQTSNIVYFIMYEHYIYGIYYSLLLISTIAIAHNLTHQSTRCRTE